MCILAVSADSAWEGGQILKRPTKPPAAALLALLACALPLASCTGYGKPNQPSTELAFGVDMARRGLWSEALFRFHAAEKADPQNPRVQNNLGVAYEAQGDFEKALSYYKRALQIAPENREMRANYTRFVEFYQSFKAPDKSAKPGKGALVIPKTAPGAAGSSAPRSGDAAGKAAPPAAPASPPPAPGEPSHLPPGPAGAPGQPPPPASQPPPGGPR
jgi:tetratricopeptide (TPR) repeat protein